MACDRCNAHRAKIVTQLSDPDHSIANEARCSLEVWDTSEQLRRCCTPPPRGPGVAGEQDRLRAALEEVIGCFEAAGAEGLIERLSELPDVSAGSLHDLFFRRILHAEHAARRAVEAYRAAAGSTGAK